MLETELLEVGKKIEHLLQSDPFPDRIQPESLRRAVLDYPLRGGKRLRPALTLWCCELLSGSPEPAAFAAAAVEVWHNWTLVHDDLIDRDPVRRGQPTEQFKLRDDFSGPDAPRYAENFALLCGDLQQGWANHLLLRSPELGVSPELTLLLARKLQTLAGADLISGEAIDTALPLRDPDQVDPDQVRHMFRLKTGALLRFAAEAGALIGCGSPDDPRVTRLGDFAELAGIAFQLRDDYLGLYGDFSRFGKPIGGDLREGKITLLLLEALRRSDPDARKQIRSLLKRDAYSPEDLNRARNLFHACGATAALETEENHLWTRAREILNSFPDSPPRQHLLSLITLLSHRTL